MLVQSRRKITPPAQMETESAYIHTCLAHGQSNGMDRGRCSVGAYRHRNGRLRCRSHRWQTRIWEPSWRGGSESCDGLIPPICNRGHFHGLNFRSSYPTGTYQDQGGHIRWPDRGAGVSKMIRSSRIRRPEIQSVKM